MTHPKKRRLQDPLIVSNNAPHHNPVRGVVPLTNTPLPSENGAGIVNKVSFGYSLHSKDKTQSEHHNPSRAVINGRGVYKSMEPSRREAIMNSIGRSLMIDVMERDRLFSDNQCKTTQATRVDDTQTLRGVQSHPNNRNTAKVTIDKEVPLESQIQNKVWDYISEKYPMLLKNSDIAGTSKPTNKIKRTKGHPDFILYYPRGQFHGLFIEFKRYAPSSSGNNLTPTTLRDEQRDFLEKAFRYGYQVAVCRTVGEGVEAVEKYIALGEPHSEIYKKKYETLKKSLLVISGTMGSENVANIIRKVGEEEKYTPNRK
jgi:hypothetical protein